MFDFIERLRAKPEHVRKRIALGTSVAVTGVVTAGWMAALVAGNAFMLEPNPETPTLAESISPLSNQAASAQASFSELMGAVNEAPGSSQNASLTIIETDTSSTLESPRTNENDNRTVIPF